MLDIVNFYKIVVHDQRVCHDIDPRSYLQGQGHNAHRGNQSPGHISTIFLDPNTGSVSRENFALFAL